MIHHHQSSSCYNLGSIGSKLYSLTHSLIGIIWWKREPLMPTPFSWLVASVNLVNCHLYQS